MFESLLDRGHSRHLKYNGESSDSISQFRSADFEARQEISKAVEAANSMLIRAHRNLSKFFSLPRVDQMNFIGKLSAHAALAKRQNPKEGLGYELYKTWLLAHIEGDQEKIRRFMDAIK